VSDPSPCNQPSWPSEAPAFLPKPGSITHLGESGCDAVSTSRCSLVAPALSQLGPARLPEPAGTLGEQRGERKGAEAEERGCAGTPISCAARPLAKGTELEGSKGAVEERGTRGGFAEVRGVFCKCDLFALRSELSQPRRGACCVGAAYFGLTREASARG